MINAGEGGILITDDADLAAQTVIMSGAYEHNWQKRTVLQGAFAAWQNKLPLYNLRLGNLSAAVIRPQLDAMPERVRKGHRNHAFVAARLNTSPHIDVPPALEGEDRVPDSLQFILKDLEDAAIARFVAAAEKAGIKVQFFGQSADNARAFWNWKFLPQIPELPKTRAMLMPV